MNNRKQVVATGVALAIVAFVTIAFFLTGSRPSAESSRIEEPYKRTQDKPPSAVPDETSAPELRKQ